MRVKFQKKNMNQFILGVLDQVFCMEVQKFINHLLITAQIPSNFINDWNTDLQFSKIFSSYFVTSHI